jgi:DNA-binding transcriptional LysR family regulator
VRFDLLSLELFVTVCEEQSIAKAADRQNIAASAVSKRISDLEGRLKTPLFVRGSKGLELTPAAHSLLHHARIVMRDLTLMESELNHHAQGMSGRIRLYASVSTIIQHLPSELRAFLALHPAIRIDLQEGTSQEVVKAVAENAADLGIFGGVVPRQGLTVIPYRTDRLKVLLPIGHALSGRRSVKFEELAEYDFIGPSKGSFLDSLVLRAGSELSGSLKMPIRVHGFETVASMVEAQLGIGLVPEVCAEHYVAHGRLTAIDLDEAWAERQWNLCVQNVHNIPPPVRSLLRHLTGSKGSLSGYQR